MELPVFDAAAANSETVLDLHPDQNPDRIEETVSRDGRMRGAETA
jgi:hypothetical protein